MPANEIELKRLMLAGLDGKATAHRALLDRLSRHLRGYYKARLARIGRSASEAEDLVQEAFDPGEPFTPWVYAIARYKLVDHLRRTRASSEDIPIEDAGALIASDDQVSTESACDLERLLSRLPAKMQQSIEFVKVEGLSVVEAAQRSGMSESAIKINIYRGLKALAALIAREKRQ